MASSPGPSKKKKKKTSCACVGEESKKQLDDISCVTNDSSESTIVSGSIVESCQNATCIKPPKLSRSSFRRWSRRNSKIPIRAGSKQLSQPPPSPIKEVPEETPPQVVNAKVEKASTKSSILSEDETSNLTAEVIGGYTPVVYTFRCTLKSRNEEIRNGLAKCPPFYLQLDHTLAVVWSLFSKDHLRRPLGIVHLQWALIFLQGIKNKNGDHPPDVQLCIHVIQDKLLEQYACMVNEVTGFIPGEDAEIMEGDDEGKQRRGSRFRRRRRSSSNSQIGLQTGHSTSTLKKPLSSRDSKTTVRRKIPFSINYFEMMKSPSGAATATSKIEQIFKANPFITEDQIKNISETITQTPELSEEFPDADTPPEDMVKFLRSWRKEQIEKIQLELKRLRSIEVFMESYDRDSSLEPLMDSPDTDVIVAKKIKSIDRSDDEASETNSKSNKGKN